MIIIATNAPLSDRNLTRLARRAYTGLARTGASFAGTSGDYAIAFSTADEVRRTRERRETPVPVTEVPNDYVTPIFVGAAEATEEAIYNSLLMATTMESVDWATGKPRKVEAIDIAKVREALARYGRGNNRTRVRSR